MRVVLLKGQSAYDALRIFIDSLAEAFAARGYEAIILDMTQGAEHIATVEQQIFSAPVSLVFSFCIFGEFRDLEGRSLAHKFGAPHVIQHVDYPLTHSHRLDATAPETALLVIDASHVEAIHSVYGAQRFAHVAFSPHAAIGSPIALEANAAAYAAARPIPILFTGTFYRPGPAPWLNFPLGARRILDNAMQIALRAEWMPALAALDSSLRDQGLEPTAPDLAPIRKMAALIHERVRTQRRLELFNAAAEVNLPIHVYGKGYEGELHRFKNVTYGGEVNLHQAIALMRQARVVLSINANFGAGSHERPLTALMAGAAAATDHSSFYAARFEVGEEIAIYRWQTLHDDLAALGRLADDPSATLAMARAGQARVMAEHQWANRIDAILSAADAAKSRIKDAA